VTGNISYSRVLPFLDDTRKFEAELENVDGLYPADQVRLSGVPVGRVDEIRVEEGRAIVTFSVEPEANITDTWEVGARWRNVIGQRYLYLYENPGGTELESGDRIPVERTRPVADIARFFDTFTPVLEALDAEQQNKLLRSLNEAFVGREERIQELVTDFGRFGNTVADEEQAVRGVLRDGNSLLAEYNARSEELSTWLTELAAVGETLNARNGELLDAVEDIATVQQEFGDLLEANDEEIIGLMDNLDVATDMVGAQRSELDATMGNLRDGLAVYMLISRFGQWFNVRGVAAQVQDGRGNIIYCQTEAGAPCADPNQTVMTSSRPSSAPFGVDALTTVAGNALGDGPGSGLAAAASGRDVAALVEGEAR